MEKEKPKVDVKAIKKAREGAVKHGKLVKKQPMEKPVFQNKLEEISWIHANKSLLIAEKQNTMKNSDVLTYKESIENTASKAELTTNDRMPNDKLALKLVINSCGIIDSHMDCHISGIWNKSIKENKLFFLLQEHEMEFEYVIADSLSDDLKATTEDIDWKTLRMPYAGKTECLIFNTTISKARNEFMFNQYMNGYVLNHSVGMRYLKMYLCIDSEAPEYAAEKESWDKYYPMVMNKEVAEEKGYFWAVTEAKFIEGSAVVRGSNIATPVLEIESKEDNEAVEDTSKNEPLKDTQTKQFFINLLNQFQHEQI